MSAVNGVPVQEAPESASPPTAPARGPVSSPVSGTVSAAGQPASAPGSGLGATQKTYIVAGDPTFGSCVPKLTQGQLGLSREWQVHGTGWEKAKRDCSVLKRDTDFRSQDGPIGNCEAGAPSNVASLVARLHASMSAEPGTSLLCRRMMTTAVNTIFCA